MTGRGRQGCGTSLDGPGGSGSRRRLFVDYAGPTMPVVHPRTGEIEPAQIFVGALGASHLLYVEATWTQTLPTIHGSDSPRIA